MSTLGPIWLIGCGTMGGAMLRRWLASGIDPAMIAVIDPESPEVPEGVGYFRNADEVQRGSPHQPHVVVLAMKPQQIGGAGALFLTAMSSAPPILISILAGVEEATLVNRFGADVTVRAMPNLPVAIGQGVTALYTSSADARDRAIAEALCRPLGHVEWLKDESLFDAVTALSGCGPGFTYRFIDALAAAGAALGLPADQALRLATATVAGSAALASASDQPPAVLADRVASPGGSTREGLNVLDRDGALIDLLTRTLTAAEHRNRELAAAAR